MNIKGHQSIAAPRQTVWEKLNDPAVLAASIEGCTRLVRTSDSQFDGTLTVKIGPVRASFDGVVSLSELNPPTSYVLTGEGKGGAAGFVKGSATVVLSDTPEGGTNLDYDASANVGGKLAQLGARLIESTARDQADKFFQKFSLQCAPASVAVDNPSEMPMLAPAASAAPGVSAWIWGPAVAALVFAALYFLARSA